MPVNSTSLRWRAFRLWKQNNAPEEYEDACAGDPGTGRFAIADGASEASFAAIWAQLLVEQFVADSGKPWRNLDWIGPLRATWGKRVDDMPLPWYAEEKRELGAFATLLGLSIGPPTEDRPGAWRAVAIGDCCLFRTRGKSLLQSFPMKRSEEFGNRPRLLASRARGLDQLDAEREQVHGRWHSGDCFLLMTDALAQWFLLRTEQEGEPLTEIRGLLAESDPKAAFPGWIDERRAQHGLRNDDVTLAVVDTVTEEEGEKSEIK